MNFSISLTINGVRRDIELEDPRVTLLDLLRALIGMCYLHDQPGWQATVLRLMDVFIDGLRVKPNGGRTATSPSRRGRAKQSAKAKR